MLVLIITPTPDTLILRMYNSYWNHCMGSHWHWEPLEAAKSLGTGRTTLTCWTYTQGYWEQLIRYYSCGNCWEPPMNHWETIVENHWQPSVESLEPLIDHGNCSDLNHWETVVTVDSHWRTTDNQLETEPLWICGEPLGTCGKCWEPLITCIPNVSWCVCTSPVYMYK